MKLKELGKEKTINSTIQNKTSMLHFYCKMIYKMRQIVLLSNGKEGEK